MAGPAHLLRSSPTVSLDGTLTKLVEPELRLEGRASAGARGQWLRLAVTFEEQEAIIVKGNGVVLHPQEAQLFQVTADDGAFSLVMASRPRPRSGKGGFRVVPSLPRFLANTYPFVTLVLGVSLRAESPMTYTFRCQLPPHTSWYVHDTHLLQRTIEATSLTEEKKFLVGRSADNVSLGAHLKYEPITALRKAAAPLLITLAALLLDLALLMQAGPGSWRTNPLALLGLFTINLGAFSSIAALDGGAQTTTLVNFERALCALFLLFLTVVAREGGVPGTLHVIDGLLKAALVWLVALVTYAFAIYGYIHEGRLRRRWLVRISLLAAGVWLAMMLWGKPAAVAEQLAGVLR